MLLCFAQTDDSCKRELEDTLYKTLYVYVYSLSCPSPSFDSSDNIRRTVHVAKPRNLSLCSFLHRPVTKLIRHFLTQNDWFLL